MAYCEFSSASGAFSRPALRRLRHALHDGVVVGLGSGGFEFGRRVVAVLGGKFLADLDAAAMAVHVAETADVHENVEAELLAGAEGAQHFVMAAAMAQAEVDDLAANEFAGRLDHLANLAIGIVAVFVDERRGEFDFQRLVIQ